MIPSKARSRFIHALKSTICLSEHDFCCKQCKPEVCKLLIFFQKFCVSHLYYFKYDVLYVFGSADMMKHVVRFSDVAARRSRTVIFNCHFTSIFSLFVAI